MGALKSPLFLGALAAVVAWWFLRKKADCHCDAPAPGAAVTPPISSNPFATNPPAPPPPAANVPPPLPGPELPAPVSWSARCVSSGGSPGWDGGPVCLFPDAPRAVPASAPAATTCPRPNEFMQQDGTCIHCGTLGGSTLPDGSCCIPAQGCNPNGPAPTAPPPVIAPAPTFTGYTSSPYTGYSGGAPAPTKPARQIRCETTSGEWGNFAYNANGERIGDCLCPRGTYQNGDGFCVTGVI